MDLNELLRAQQIALMKADLSLDAAERAERLEQVAAYAESIVALRAHWTLSPDAPATLPDSMIDWENEGGALGSHDGSAPIDVSMVAKYAVGPYRYDTLAYAVAQQERFAAANTAHGEDAR